MANEDALSALGFDELNGLDNAIELDSESITNIIELETNIKNIESRLDQIDIIKINDESYIKHHNLLVEKDGRIFFENVLNIDNSFKLFNFENKEFIQIESLEKVENVETEVYFIECDMPIVIQSSVGFMTR